MKKQFAKQLIYALGIGAILLTINACEKPDKYIDWKMINDKWYEAHRNDAGFEVDPSSGLCYRRTSAEANPAERKPNPGDWVQLKYKNTYVDGTVINDRTEAFLLSAQPQGFQEAILKMREGETYHFYIPYPIAYGSKGQAGIPPYSTLIYEITLERSGAN